MQEALSRRPTEPLHDVLWMEAARLAGDLTEAGWSKDAAFSLAKLQMFETLEQEMNAKVDHALKRVDSDLAALRQSFADDPDLDTIVERYDARAEAIVDRWRHWIRWHETGTSGDG